MQLLKLDKNNKILDGPTIMLRIHDNQREWMPPKGFTSDVDNTHLPQERLARFAFSNTPNNNPAEHAKTAIPAPLQVSKEAYKTAIMAAFSKRYRV